MAASQNSSGGGAFLVARLFAKALGRDRLLDEREAPCSPAGLRQLLELAALKRPDPLTAAVDPPGHSSPGDTVRVLVGPCQGEEVIVTTVHGDTYEVAFDEKLSYEMYELWWLWS